MTIAEQLMAREKGIVKWFSTDKGYGFIRRDSGDEIFVHHTDIEVDGYAALKNGETVEFDVFESDRGPKARNLVPLDVDGTKPAPRAKTGDGRARGGRGAGPAPEAKAERGSRGGRRESGDRKRSGSSGKSATAATAGGKVTLAQQLRERLSKRFPGLGA
jgi:CspA family cold shock protein